MSELQHLVFFLERSIHVASMAFMLGGTLLLWVLAHRSRGLDEDDHPRLLQFAAEKYEFFFWIAIGLQVITGIGNLASLGADLPAPQTAWGIKLTIKLSLVLILILLSLVRTVLVIRLGLRAFGATTLRLPSLFETIYGSTTLVLITVVILAEALAHG
jgi:uncharacterized membrane protein